MIPHLFARVMVGLFVVSGYAQQGGASPMRIHDLKSHGIEILAPGHPQFEIEAMKILANKDQAFGDIVKNVSLVIRNTADKTVVGYALRWDFRDANGKISRHKAAYLQPGGLLDGGRVKFSHTLPGSTLIPPGTTRLVSPFASLGSNELRFDKGIESQLQAEIEKFSSQLHQSSEISVHADSILFEDGTFAGPDELGVMRDFIRSFDAEQEFYRHIAELISVGTSQAEIVAWVEWQRANDPGNADSRAFAVHVAASEFLAVHSKFNFATAVRLAKSKLYEQRPAFINADSAKH